MKISLLRILAFVALLILLSPVSLFAADAPLESERLKELNQKIKSLQDERKAISAGMQANEKFSSQLTQEITVVQEGLRLSAAEISNFQAASSRLSLEVADFEERYKDLSRQSSARLRAMYMLGGGQQMSLSMVSQGKASLGQITHYMNALRSHEVSNLSELQRLKLERLKRVSDLELKKVELQAIYEKSRKQQEDLRKKQSDLELTRAALKKQASGKTRILSELRSEVLRIETVLSSILQSPDLSLQSDSKSNQAKQSEDAAIVSELKQQMPSRSSGQGLAAKFLAPVRGKIVVQYGSLIADGSDQPMKSKGLCFTAPDGQDIQAVGSGTVSFVGVLGDYGSVVILDHGNRMYSLYSQIANISVSLGQQIEDRQVLGTIGPIVAPRLYNLYFEIRKEGKVIDPKPYLR